MRNAVGALAGVAIAVGVLVTFPQAQAPAVPSGPSRPKLLVLLVVDQMRGDYVEKFQQQWTRGLRRMVTEGAWFRQSAYPYFNAVTCAGHASIGTGTVPAVHGMILNNWWERTSKKQVACTDDDRYQAISYGKAVAPEGESAARLRTTTLADELRAQLGTPPLVAAFSLKARSAVTLGGQHPDAVAWFDDDGAWVTSTAFSTGPVPEVASFVRANPVEKQLGAVWDRALPKEAYLYEEHTIGMKPARGGMTPTFPHILKGSAGAADKMFYDQWQSSPFADEYLAHMGVSVMDALHVGQRTGPSLLAISFSTLDKVGHDYGPNSHEIQDILVRLDKTIGDLFTALDRLVGVGNYTVALSADHGVPPVPERMQGMGLDAGRLSTDTIVEQAERSLTASLGPGHYVTRFVHDYLYLEPAALEQLRTHPAARRGLLGDLRTVTGVSKAYWRDDLAENNFAGDPIGRRAALSFDADRSGDVMVVFKPYWIASNTTASHGSGYAYDTHVPVLLMGKGIARGQYLEAASPIDIAPTLAFLAGVTLPQATGRVLVEGLARGPAHEPAR